MHSEAVPQSNTVAENDRHQDNVEGVDEVGGEELANDRRTAADAHVEFAGGLPGDVESLSREEAST